METVEYKKKRKKNLKPAVVIYNWFSLEHGSRILSLFACLFFTELT